MCKDCCSGSLTKLRHHLERKGTWCSKKILGAVLPKNYLGQIISMAKYHDGIIHRAISNQDINTAEVASAHISVLMKIARAATPTHMADIDKEQVAFVIKHASAQGLWVSPGKEVVKLSTKYNIYNRDTLMHTILRAGTVGIATEDIFVEYQNAYIDLNQLITENKVTHKEGTIWGNQR